jgi:predicted SAM-dependent methyltransferase
MSGLKHRLGTWLIPRMPVSPWVFRTFRVELNAVSVRLLNRIHPGRLAAQRALRRRNGLLVNVGCGPFGREGWVNLDLFPAPGVTMRVDCRRAFPLADGSARGIHVEHYLEHLEPTTERPRFLAECRRCLEPGGVLRVAVPDLELFIEAYQANGWDRMNEVVSAENRLENSLASKADALNHIFLQDGEHYGAFDEKLLTHTLAAAGFRNVARVAWRQGRFPGGAIDREQHRPYSLYMEAIR